MFCSTLSRSATLSNRHMNLPTLGKLTHGNSKQDDSYSPVGGSPVRPFIERISHPRQPVAQAAHSLLLTSPQLNWLAMYVPSPYHTIPYPSPLCCECLLCPPFTYFDVCTIHPTDSSMCSRFLFRYNLLANSGRLRSPLLNCALQICTVSHYSSQVASCYYAEYQYNTRLQTETSNTRFIFCQFGLTLDCFVG